MCGLSSGSIVEQRVIKMNAVRVILFVLLLGVPLGLLSRVLLRGFINDVWVGFAYVWHSAITGANQEEYWSEKATGQAGESGGLFLGALVGLTSMLAVSLAYALFLARMIW